MGWSDRDIVNATGMHLSGTAQRWFSDHILDCLVLSDLDWPFLKGQFISRFGRKQEDPPTLNVYYIYMKYLKVKSLTSAFVSQEM